MVKKIIYRDPNTVTHWIPNRGWYSDSILCQSRTFEYRTSLDRFINKTNILFIPKRSRQAAILFLPLEIRTKWRPNHSKTGFQKCPKNDHWITGRSGIRWVTVIELVARWLAVLEVHKFESWCDKFNNSLFHGLGRGAKSSLIYEH